MNTKEVGNLIKRRRAALQVDQCTLCALAGISIHTLSNIEAGKGNPTLATLEPVLDALGLEIHVRVKP